MKAEIMEAVTGEGTDLMDCPDLSHLVLTFPSRRLRRLEDADVNGNDGSHGDHGELVEREPQQMRDVGAMKRG